MKYLTHILALSASAHLSIALSPRAIRALQIDGFVAQGFQGMDGDKHLSLVGYSITLQAGEGNAWCWPWADVPDFSISDIPTTVCQADHTVKWSFIKTADSNYNFTVSWQYTGHGHLTGSYLVPSEQVQCVTGPLGQAGQDYVGPTSFSIDTVDVFGSW
ncbi:hypothetical protein GE09DRAFT_1062303 [Coniochaeta sp. 2T2.1]|nr:hypothetical protein GE09DRAFT_1062303 [Coniochaeta sp. 2T2.1]